MRNNVPAQPAQTMTCDDYMKTMNDWSLDQLEKSKFLLAMKDRWFNDDYTFDRALDRMIDLRKGIVPVNDYPRPLMKAFHVVATVTMHDRLGDYNYEVEYPILKERSADRVTHYVQNHIGHDTLKTILVCEEVKA